MGDSVGGVGAVKKHDHILRLADVLGGVFLMGLEAGHGQVGIEQGKDEDE